MKEFPDINRLSYKEYDEAKDRATEKLKILLGDGEIEQYKKLKADFNFSRDEDAQIIAEALLACLEFKDNETIKRINESKIIQPNIINDLKRKLHDREIGELQDMGLEIQ